MNTLFKIESITENLIPSSADVIRCSFSTVAEEFNLTGENCPTNGAFLNDDKLFEEYKRGIKMFGVFENETQIGFMALEQNDSTFFIEKLAVLPEYRHNGCGKALLDFAADYVCKAGGNIISIGVIYENKQLLKWYEDYGFVITEVKKIPMLPFTVCLMKLDL